MSKFSESPKSLSIIQVGISCILPQSHGIHNNQHKSEMSVKMRNIDNYQGEKGEKKHCFRWF